MSCAIRECGGSVEDVYSPFNCSHDELRVCVDVEVSEEDRARLEEIGIHWSEADESWYSFRYGSC